MHDISIGAVGAAAIAALVSLLGLIIGKEQKVSEFRQAWIDQLRKSIVSFIVNINAISDALRLQKAEKPFDQAAFLTNYKLLNEARTDIILRINSKEKTAKALISSISEFEQLAANNSSLTPDKIRDVEQKFIKASQKLLKFEWKRVKRGEDIFVWTKRVVSALIILMLVVLAYIWHQDAAAEAKNQSRLSNFTSSPSSTRFYEV